MDPESESESDEEGEGGDEEGGGLAGVTSRIKKRLRDERFPGLDSGHTIQEHAVDCEVWPLVHSGPRGERFR